MLSARLPPVSEACSKFCRCVCASASLSGGVAFNAKLAGLALVSSYRVALRLMFAYNVQLREGDKAHLNDKIRRVLGHVLHVRSQLSWERTLLDGTLEPGTAETSRQEKIEILYTKKRRNNPVKKLLGIWISALFVNQRFGEPCLHRAV